MTIIDKQDRNVLGEGRNYGVGFAFLKQVGDNYETIQPISPCKDYLNDVVFSERTGKPWRAHGLSTAKKDIFHDPYAFIALKILFRKNGTPYAEYEQDKKALSENYRGMTLFMNKIEDEFNISHRTSVLPGNDDMALCLVPLFWTEATWLISLWSLLIRNSLCYDPKTPFRDHLKAIKTEDQYMLTSAMPKLERLIKGPIPKQDMEGISPHNLGIISFQI